VAVIVFIAAIRAIHVSVAHKVFVDAATGVTLEELRRTCQVSVATFVDWLVFTVRAITIIITNPMFEEKISSIFFILIDF
jgi:hypothetical protein